MEDGELDFSNQEVFSSSEMGELPASNCSMDSLFDGLLMDTNAACSCTHTHTCNPTGPESTHTHTCFHVHTKILPDESDERVSIDDTAECCGKKGEKRPLGNREAVRKYREKKKAKAASLEDEVARLRAVNQQLVKRLQNQATLEDEVARLKCLLVDLRGRIDGEIGSFPYQKPMTADIPSFSHMMNPYNVQCDDEVYCPQNVFGVNSQEGASINDQGLSDSDFDQLQCMANQNLSGNGNGSFNNANTSVSNKRKVLKSAPVACHGAMRTEARRRGQQDMEARRGEIYDARAIHEPWPMHEAVKASASCVQAKTLRNHQQELCDLGFSRRR